MNEKGGQHACSDLAGEAGRPGGDGPGPRDRTARRRDRTDHLDRYLWLRPAPVRSTRAVPGPGRHPGARIHGRRRGSRPRGALPRPRGPGRHPVQRLVRHLLHVLSGPAVAVRDDTGARVRLRRLPVRLHQAVRPGAGRTGRVPAGAVRQLSAHQGARGAAGRPLRVSLRRAADRLAGRRVRGGAARRIPHRARARADRRHGHAHRPAPGRRPGHRRRPGGRTPSTGRPRTG